MSSLHAAGRVHQPSTPPTPAELTDACSSGEFDVVVAQLGDRFDAQLLAQAKLAGISNYAVGYDNIDIPAATGNKIVVGNTPGVLTDATADLTMLLILATAHRAIEADQFTRSGQFTGWKPDLLLGHDVSGATGAQPSSQPAADGGEGTLTALTEPLALQHITVPTIDPWGVTIDATYGMSPTKTAVVEVAAASGYHSAISRQPGAAIDASTYGTGVLIADAIDRGAGPCCRCRGRIRDHRRWIRRHSPGVQAIRDASRRSRRRRPSAK